MTIMKDDQRELFIVVDKDDNILDYRTRYDCHHDKMLIHRAIGVIIFNDNGDILLQKRSKEKDLNAGKYTISVGGHLLKGQSYEDAAMREMQEELGIQTPLTFMKKFIIYNNQESTMAVLFKGYYNGPFSKSKEEIETLKFVSPEKMKKMSNKFTPNTQETFRQIGLL